MCLRALLFIRRCSRGISGIRVCGQGFYLMFVLRARSKRQPEKSFLTTSLLKFLPASRQTTSALDIRVSQPSLFPLRVHLATFRWIYIALWVGIYRCIYWRQRLWESLLLIVLLGVYYWTGMSRFLHWLGELTIFFATIIDHRFQHKTTTRSGTLFPGYS